MEESLLLNGIHLYHLGRTNIKPYVYGVEAGRGHRKHHPPMFECDGRERIKSLIRRIGRVRNSSGPRSLSP
ncbi:MAG TPA: hypothetical protein VJ949_05715, partial [Cryomorphaceae bacterium]|nr:hypothetical protein [Cryomorphaceae bacterium]